MCGSGKIKKWRSNDWYYCDSFTFEDGDVWPLYEFKYEPIEEPAMSELAGWIPENTKHGVFNLYPQIKQKPCEIHGKENPPKKKSWLQKIRDYDRQEEKINRSQFEFDRLWKEFGNSFDNGCKMVASILDLNKRIQSAEARLENIGKRLKWKSSNVEFVVIVGNPVTLIEANFPPLDKEKDEYFSDTCSDYSVCKHSDTFDWKKGVMQALFNFFKTYIQDSDIQSMMQRDLYKKYPELK
jgi:hypothetical protein